MLGYSHCVINSHTRHSYDNRHAAQSLMPCSSNAFISCYRNKREGYTCDLIWTFALRRKNVKTFRESGYVAASQNRPAFAMRLTCLCKATYRRFRHLLSVGHLVHIQPRFIRPVGNYKRPLAGQAADRHPRHLCRPHRGAARAHPVDEKMGRHPTWQQSPGPGTATRVSHLTHWHACFALE